MPDAVCISAQTVTSPRVSIHIRLSNCGDNHMLFIVGVGIVLITVGIISWMRVPVGQRRYSPLDERAMVG